MFIKYPHLRKEPQQGLSDYYKFWKLDGSNCQISCEDGELKFGSRNVPLTKDWDFCNFRHIYSAKKNIADFFALHADLIIYGEFLPNKKQRYLKEYSDCFIVFDVLEKRPPHGELYFLDYREYAPMLEKFEIDFLKPIEDDEAEKSPYINVGKTDEGVVFKRPGAARFNERIMWKHIFGEPTKTPQLCTVEDEHEFRRLEDLYCTDQYIEKEIEKFNSGVADGRTCISHIMQDFYAVELSHLEDKQCKKRLCAVLSKKLTSKKWRERMNPL